MFQLPARTLPVPMARSLLGAGVLVRVPRRPVPRTRRRHSPLTHASPGDAVSAPPGQSIHGESVWSDSCDVTTPMPSAQGSQMGDTNWGRLSLVALLAHLAERHHEGPRDELHRLRRLLEEELELRPDARGSLAAIGYAMHALDVVVGAHVGETAAPLFAHATTLEMNAGTRVLSPSATSGLIHKLRVDHQRIETLLDSMKLATDDFAVPDAASRPLRELYAGLASWERSAREHAHLENDVLVGSILMLEPSIERDADPVSLPIHTRRELSGSRPHEKRT